MLDFFYASTYLFLFRHPSRSGKVLTACVKQIKPHQGLWSPADNHSRRGSIDKQRGMQDTRTYIYHGYPHASSEQNPSALLAYYASICLIPAAPMKILAEARLDQSSISNRSQYGLMHTCAWYHLRCNIMMVSNGRDTGAARCKYQVLPFSLPPLPFLFHCLSLPC